MRIPVEHFTATPVFALSPAVENNAAGASSVSGQASAGSANSAWREATSTVKSDSSNEQVTYINAWLIRSTNKAN